MSVSLSPSLRTVIASTLRSAGCVYAEDEALLIAAAATTPLELDRLVEQRVSGMPLEYILGWAEFCGLRISIDPGVFVPRLRTELLVREAAALAAPGAVVVDLCCGSGAVGAALLSQRDIELHSADIDPIAVRCTGRNVDAPVYEGDLFDALPLSLKRRVDVLIANAPYVPSATIAFLPSDSRDYEAHVALDGGADGMDILRRVVRHAPAWLAPRGKVVVELSDRQEQQGLELLTSAGFRARSVRSDELDATVLIGQLAVGLSLISTRP